MNPRREMYAIAVWAILACVFAAGSVGAAEGVESSGSLLKMKAGLCEFRVLDSRGVRPLSGSTLTLSSVEDGKLITKSTVDKAGKCSLEIVAGRYILGVNDLNLAILETSDKTEIAECKIIVPEEAMVVGGQEKGAAAGGEKEGKKAGVPWLSSKPFIVGTTVFLAVGGGYTIYKHNEDDEDGPASP